MQNEELLKLTKQQLKNLAQELNNGVEIDWTDCEIDKYYIYLDNSIDELSFGVANSHINLGQVYCLDSYFLKKAKERIGEERLIELIKSGI